MTMAKQAHPLGLYLHIPFCKSKCAYCDFYSLSGREDRMDAYTAALERHLAEVAPQAAQHLVDTVYFGGGTPSYLGEKRLVKLLKAVKKHYHVDSHAEITLEANPDSAGDWKALRALRRAGFNRISLGVQSTDDACLRALGRIHTWQQVQEAVAACRRAKFPDVSLDLIYGLPGQTMEQWEKTLSDALTLQPEHLSCYGLKLEEGTPLYRQRDSLTLPDDEAQADMYLYAVEYLRQNGYEQYEISNFARPGHASRHNLKYWTLGEYAGFGPGAYSDFGGVRYGYIRDLDRYIAGELVLAESEHIPASEREMEYIMLRLRTTEGMNIREFENRFRRRFDPLGARLEVYADHGLAQRTEQGWRLTPRGFLVSNQIIGELQELLNREKLERLRKELEDIKAKVAASKVTSLFDNAETVGDVKIASAYFTGTSGDTLRGMCDTIRDNAKAAAVAVLVGKSDDKITMAVTVTKDAQAKGLKAGNLVKEISAIAGGKGGGKPDFAMAGLKDETKIDEALAAVKSIVEKQLG